MTPPSSSSSQTPSSARGKQTPRNGDSASGSQISRSIGLDGVRRGARMRQLRSSLRSGGVGGHRPASVGPRDHLLRHRGHLRTARPLRGVPGEGAEGPPRRRHHRHEVRGSHRAGAAVDGNLAALHPARGRGESAAAGNGLHRPLPAPLPLSRRADGGDPPRARRSRAPGEGPLRRQLQLRGVAARRCELDRAYAAPVALHLDAAPVQPAGPADRARAAARLSGTRHRPAALLPARQRFSHRQVPAGRATAGGRSAGGREPQDRQP